MIRGNGRIYAVMWALIEIAAILAAVGLGIFIRLQPALRYGLNLTADDPLLHYRMTKDLIEEGHIPEYDPMGWHPWSYDPRERLPVFHYYLGAALYHLMRFLGSDLTIRQACVLIPAFFAPLAAIPVYLLARRLWGGRLGAAAGAISVTITWAYAQRSVAGFYRHEQFAIPFLVGSLAMSIYAATEDRLWKSVVWGALSGILLVFSAGLWAGFRLFFDGYALFLLAGLLLGRLTRQMEFGFGLPPIYVSLASMGLIPQLTHKVFYLSVESSVAYAAVAAVLLYEAWSAYGGEGKLGSLITRRRVLSVLALAVIALGVGYAAGFRFSGKRFIKVFNPGADLGRGNVIDTVAEHQTNPQASARSIGFLLIPGLLGLGLMLIERWRDPVHLGLVLLASSSVYFAMSFARLPPISAPFLSLSTAYLAHRLGESYSGASKRIRAMEEYLRKRKREVTLGQKIGRLWMPLTMLGLMVIAPLAVSGYNAYSYASGYGLGYPRGWDDALSWIRNSTDPTDVVISWWDYGYWLADGARRVSLADGLNINASQVRVIAKSFIGTEEDMLNTAMKYNASYVVVDLFAEVCNMYTGQCLTGAGKWMAMAWIAERFVHNPFTGDRAFAYEDFPLFFRRAPGTNRTMPTDFARNLTLFKLAIDAFSKGGVLQRGSAQEPEFFELAYESKVGGFPRVVVYRIRGW